MKKNTFTKCEYFEKFSVNAQQLKKNIDEKKSCS